MKAIDWDSMSFDTSDVEMNDAADLEVADSEGEVEEEITEAKQAEVVEEIKDDRKSTILYFDIETIPDDSRMGRFGFEIPEEKPITAMEDCPDPDCLKKKAIKEIKGIIAEVNPCAQWLAKAAELEAMNKGRASLIGYLTEQAAAVESGGSVEREETIKLLSTTPEYCKIAAIGTARGGNKPQGSVLGDEHDERSLLEMFWTQVAHCGQLVGFNVLHFDLPVIFVRSALLGVEPTRLIDMKPWGRDVIDLYHIRFGSRGNTDKKRPGKLKDLARVYGLEVPAEDVDGGQVYQLMQDNPAKVGEYVCSDIEVTRALHRFYQGYFCL